MNDYGRIRRSMGPVRWWFWQHGQRRMARDYGYDVGRWGGTFKDPTALSSKLDPELGEIFQKEFGRGYAEGYWMRRVLALIFFIGMLALAAMLVGAWLDGLI